MHRQLKIASFIFLLALVAFATSRFVTRAPQVTLQSVDGGMSNSGAAANSLSPVQQVTLRSVDGETFDLAANKGRVIVFLFSATWSPLVDQSLPAFQRLADRYAGRAVTFYWVSINSRKAGDKTYASDADLQAFAERAGLRLTVLRDPDRAAFRAFGLDAVPTIVMIDREGQLARKHVGFDSERPEGYSVVSRSLDQLLR
jgi:peroxiredoxin